MVSQRRFIIEPLDERHDRTTFSSGSLALDRYFIQQAGQEQRRGVAVIYVARDSTQDGAIAGFYSLSATSVLATSLPRDIAKKLPRYPNLPAVLLGRLARDERWRGQQVGPRLVVDAFDRVVVIASQIGALFMIVDAKDETAQRFYERFGFQRFPDVPSSLFLSIAVIRAMQERFNDRS